MIKKLFLDAFFFLELNIFSSTFSLMYEIPVIANIIIDSVFTERSLHLSSVSYLNRIVNIKLRNVKWSNL